MWLLKPSTTAAGGSSGANPFTWYVASLNLIIVRIWIVDADIGGSVSILYNCDLPEMGGCGTGWC
jgi:hypothetical protein